MAIENSVRLDVLLVLQELYAALEDGPNSLKFSTVQIGPLGDPDYTKRLSLGIVVGKEQKSGVSRAENCTLPVDIEFRITVNQGDASPAVLGEWVLSVIQQVINTNPDLNGLVMDMREKGNEVSLDTYSDRTVMGVVNYEILYRHAERDVRNPLLSV